MSQAEDPLPYAFHLLTKPKASTSTAPIRLQINNSLLADALTPPTQSTSQRLTNQPNEPESGYSPEDVFEVLCEPQAVFRVRSVGRCSSTLTGHQSPILCCQLSPTGRLAATGSGDANARIWDMETELPKVSLPGSHQDSPDSVVHSLRPQRLGPLR